ncbi:flavodoxin family protein [Chloroflexota bacterium]
MSKVIIVYESKWGNTRQVAETIGEGIKENQESEVNVQELGDIDIDKVSEYDVILIGSPNHMGGPTRGIKKFIEKLGKLGLEGKRAAVFDTSFTRDYEKAIKRMEFDILKKASGLQLIQPGLSVIVNGTKGPLADGELDKCRDYGIKLGARI